MARGSPEGHEVREESKLGGLTRRLGNLWVEAKARDEATSGEEGDSGGMSTLPVGARRTWRKCPRREAGQGRWSSRDVAQGLWVMTGVQEDLHFPGQAMRQMCALGCRP